MTALGASQVVLSLGFTQDLINWIDLGIDPTTLLSRVKLLCHNTQKKKKIKITHVPGEGVGLKQ